MKKERLTSRYIEHDIVHAKIEQRFRLTEHFICYFVPLLMIAVILSLK